MVCHNDEYIEGVYQITEFLKTANNLILECKLNLV